MSKVPAVVEILSIEAAASFLNGLPIWSTKKNVEKNELAQNLEHKFVSCGKNELFPKTRQISRRLQDESIGSLLCRIVTSGPTSKDRVKTVNPCGFDQLKIEI